MKRWGQMGTIKNEILVELISLFMEQNMVRQLNHTFITLICKVERAASVEEFRLISCVIFLHKIHSKLLAYRMQKVTPFLISENQAAFIVGRLISDQGKLAKELIAGFGRKATPKRFCMIVDLKKGF